MATALGYHSHDYFMVGRTPSQQPGLKDTPLLTLKKKIYHIVKGPGGKELCHPPKTERNPADIQQGTSHGR